MTVLVFVTILIALCVGGILTAVGLCGRRIDDHPLCRKCGFDLTGKPGDTDRCGECGADLPPPNAVRVGHRRRRAVAISAGAILLTVGAGVLTVCEYGRLKGTNWLNHAPLWLVLRQASSTNAAERGPALDELGHRSWRGRLSDVDRRRIVLAALAYQGDSSKPWDDRWGDLFESQDDARLVSARQWEQYVTQSMEEPPTFTVDDVVQIGEVLHTRVRMPAARIARHSKVMILGYASVGGIEYLPRPEGRFYPAGGGSGMAGPIWSSESSHGRCWSTRPLDQSEQIRVEPDLPPSRHRLSCTVHYSSEGTSEAGVPAKRDIDVELTQWFTAQAARH